eukprot:gene22970-1391_t
MFKPSWTDGEDNEAAALLSLLANRLVDHRPWEASQLVAMGGQQSNEDGDGIEIRSPTASVGGAVKVVDGNDFKKTSMKAWVMRHPAPISEIQLLSVTLGNLRDNTMHHEDGGGCRHNILQDIPRPVQGEVRIRMACASLSSHDVARAQYTTGVEFPAILGVDGSGIVDAVGNGVENVHVGQRVYFHCDLTQAHGAFAQYSVQPATTTIPIPDDLSFADAAALPSTSWPAYVALVRKIKIEPNKTLVILGAEDPMAIATIAICQLQQVKVIGIVGTKGKISSLSMLPSYENCTLLDAEDENIHEQLRQATNDECADYCLELVKLDLTQSITKYMRFGGHFCSLVGSAPEALDLFVKGLTLHSVYLPQMLMTHAHESVKAWVYETG